MIPNMLMGMMGASDVKPFLREQQFISPGTYEFVVPRGVKEIKALVIGAGCLAERYNSSAGNLGGRGGGVISGVIPVKGGDAFTVTVGSIATTGGASALVRAGTTILQGFGGTLSARGATSYNALVTILSNYNAVDLPTATGKGAVHFLQMANDDWAYYDKYYPDNPNPPRALSPGIGLPGSQNSAGGIGGGVGGGGGGGAGTSGQGSPGIAETGGGGYGEREASPSYTGGASHVTFRAYGYGGAGGKIPNGHGGGGGGGGGLGYGAKGGEGGGPGELSDGYHQGGQGGKGGDGGLFGGYGGGGGGKGVGASGGTKFKAGKGGRGGYGGDGGNSGKGGTLTIDDLSASGGPGAVVIWY